MLRLFNALKAPSELRLSSLQQTSSTTLLMKIDVAITPLSLHNCPRQRSPQKICPVAYLCFTSGQDLPHDLPILFQLLKLFLDLEVDVSVGDNILDDVLIQLAAQSSVGDTGSLEYSN